MLKLCQHPFKVAKGIYLLKSTHHSMETKHEKCKVFTETSWRQSNQFEPKINAEGYKTSSIKFCSNVRHLSLVSLSIVASLLNIKPTYKLKPLKELTWHKNSYVYLHIYQEDPKASFSRGSQIREEDLKASFWRADAWCGYFRDVFS